MLDLRYYQRAAIDALYDFWDGGGGNGLIVLPTGAGKALVIAKIIEEMLAGYPDIRIANITHSATLVEQNYKEFIGLQPFAPAGLYSASLKRKDANAQILFGGIQSIYGKTKTLGPIDLVMVDEAHAISRNSDSQYGEFFAGVAEHNPQSRVMGLTATDYRMDSGRLTEGEGALFHEVVYEIGIGELIEQGYLTRLTSSRTTAKIDLKGVATRGGDYVPGQVATAAENIIDAAVAEDIILSEGRRAGLFFCAGKENAEHVARAVRQHGRTCASLTSDNSHETKKIFEEFRAGRLWGIASVGMITTGANFPFVDFISLIMSTKSAGKLVQILGRGTRNSPGKIECLIADHGKNLAYHGPIDQIRPKEPGKGDGEQPKKECPTESTDVNGSPGCGELIPISRMVCHCCGYVFPPSEEEKITARPDEAPVLSSEKPWFPVKARTFRHHPGKEGKPDTVKCTYMVGMKAVNEWLCCGHSGFAKAKADRYWHTHGGSRPFPADVLEWLGRQHELADTAEVQLDYTRDARYPDVKAYRVGAANDNVPEPANDNRSAVDWEDAIPF